MLAARKARLGDRELRRRRAIGGELVDAGGRRARSARRSLRISAQSPIAQTPRRSGTERSAR
jgi:hypothetical protein